MRPENGDDPILALVPPERRDTLIAQPSGDVWRFDIVLQGNGEDCFLRLLMQEWISVLDLSDPRPRRLDN